MNENKAKSKLIDHSLAVFTILIWGVTFISTKVLSEYFSSLEILFIRYLAAYASLWVICPKWLKFSSAKQEAYFIAAGISGATLYQYLENLSITYTSPASVSFITALAPIFTAIFARIFLKEKLNFGILLGMLVSLAGVFFISFGDSKMIETGLRGDLIIFCSVWLWAVYSVIVKKIAAFGYPGFLVTRRIFFYALIALLPAMLTRLDTIDFRAIASPVCLMNFAFLGVFASAICFMTWNRSVDRLGAIVTSKYLFVMPVITLIGQVIYDRGTIGSTAILGMALILAGLALSQIGSGIKKHPSP